MPNVEPVLSRSAHARTQKMNNNNIEKKKNQNKNHDVDVRNPNQKPHQPQDKTTNMCERAQLFD